MKETKHYCDRCGNEIKYFFLIDSFPYMVLSENTFNDVTKNDKTGAELNITRRSKSDKYELCHKCKKEFKKFMNGI